jgi:hypothetical protein
MNALKKFLIVSAAVVTIGGVGSVTVSGTAHATSDWDKWGKHKNDEKKNDSWRVFEYIQKKVNELKKGGPVLHEHSALVNALIKAQIQGTADLPSVAGAVDLNSIRIAEVVENLYPGSKDQSLALWRSHITAYTDYVVAAQNGDQNGKDVARAKLEVFVNDYTTLLDNISSRLDRAATANHMREHYNNTLSMIDSMLAGDWAQAYAKAHVDFEHMTVASVDLLLGAKFKW